MVSGCSLAAITQISVLLSLLAVDCRLTQEHCAQIHILLCMSIFIKSLNDDAFPSPWPSRLIHDHPKYPQLDKKFPLWEWNMSLYSRYVKSHIHMQSFTVWPVQPPHYNQLYLNNFTFCPQYWSRAFNNLHNAAYYIGATQTRIHIFLILLISFFKHSMSGRLTVIQYSIPFQGLKLLTFWCSFKIDLCSVKPKTTLKKNATN